MTPAPPPAWAGSPRCPAWCGSSRSAATATGSIASATCGPTLDKLKPVAAAHPNLTFINVEPYQLKDDNGQLQPVLDAQGALVPVEATNAFKLNVEPYVFVVGADGKVVASFELVFSPEEIEAAIKAVE